MENSVPITFLILLETTVIASALFALLLLAQRKEKLESYFEARTRFNWERAILFLVILSIMLLLISPLASFALLSAVGALLFQKANKLKHLHLVTFCYISVVIILPALILLRDYSPGSDFRRDLIYAQFLLDKGFIEYVEGVPSYYSTLSIPYLGPVFMALISNLDLEVAFSIQHLLMAVTSVIFIFLVAEKFVKNPHALIATALFALFNYYVYVVFIARIPQGFGFLFLPMALYASSIALLKSSSPMFMVFILSTYGLLGHPWGPFMFSLLMMTFGLANLISLGEPKRPSKITWRAFNYAILVFAIFFTYISSLPEFQVLSYLLRQTWHLLMGSADIPKYFTTEAGQLWTLTQRFSSNLERVLYSLNWSIPTAIVLFGALALTYSFISKRRLYLNRLLNSNIVVALLLLALGGMFAISGMELAYARYTIPYALLIAITSFGYILAPIMRTKPGNIFVTVLILILAFSVLTSPRVAPYISLDKPRATALIPMNLRSEAEEINSIGYRLQTPSIILADFRTPLHMLDPSIIKSVSRPKDEFRADIITRRLFVDKAEPIFTAQDLNKEFGVPLRVYGIFSLDYLQQRFNVGLESIKNDPQIDLVYQGKHFIVLQLGQS